MTTPQLEDAHAFLREAESRKATWLDEQASYDRDVQTARAQVAQAESAARQAEFERALARLTPLAAAYKTAITALIDEGKGNLVDFPKLKQLYANAWGKWNAHQETSQYATSTGLQTVYTQTRKKLCAQFNETNPDRIPAYDSRFELLAKKIAAEKGVLPPSLPRPFEKLIDWILRGPGDSGQKSAVVFFLTGELHTPPRT